MAQRKSAPQGRATLHYGHPTPVGCLAATLLSCWPHAHLLEDLSRHQVAAVEDDAEFPAPLHLLEQRPGVVGVQRELADLQADVVAGRGHDELLQPYQAFKVTQRQTHSVTGLPSPWARRLSASPALYRMKPGPPSLLPSIRPSFKWPLPKGSKPRCHTSTINWRSCSRTEWLFLVVPCHHCSQQSWMGSLHWENSRLVLTSDTSGITKKFS